MFGDDCSDKDAVVFTLNQVEKRWGEGSDPW